MYKNIEINVNTGPEQMLPPPSASPSASHILSLVDGEYLTGPSHSRPSTLSTDHGLLSHQVPGLLELRRQLAGLLHPLVHQLR